MQSGIPTADGVNIEASMPKLHTSLAHRPNRLGEEARCYLRCVFPLALENQCRHGRAGIGSSPNIQTRTLENIVQFQRLFPLGRGKWTIRVERAECLEVHKSMILMALPTGVEPVFSD